jgi:hypothetical protein
MIKNKPFIFKSKWFVAMFCFPELLLLITMITAIFQLGFEGLFALTFSIIPIFLMITFFLFVYICFIMKDYSICFVNDVDFRDAVIFSLNNASIKFEEKMNKVELIELNNELNIAFTSWVGMGVIKLKNKKDEIIFMKIIDGIKQFLKEKNIKTKKTIAVFFLIFGILFIIFGAGVAVLFYKYRAVLFK